MAKAAQPKNSPQKGTSLSGTAQVQSFIAAVDHLLKNVMVVLRRLVLNADASITEHIKWNAPGFCHNGDDRVTFINWSRN